MFDQELKLCLLLVSEGADPLVVRPGKHVAQAEVKFKRFRTVCMCAPHNNMAVASVVQTVSEFQVTPLYMSVGLSGIPLRCLTAPLFYG